jgi:flavodoxin I
MPRIGLFYASSAAFTADVEKELTDLAPLGEIDLFDIGSSPAETMSAYRYMIICVPIQEANGMPDWRTAYLPQMRLADLSESIVVFYGIGPKKGCSELFLGMISTLYDLVIEKGGIIVGSWPIDTYDLYGSALPGEAKEGSVTEGHEDANGLEAGCLKEWLAQITPYFF